MYTDTNTDSAAFTRLLDDLLWLRARGNPDDVLREAVKAMIADYTDDANHYSGGSRVWEWYDEFPGYYFGTKGAPHLPPHRNIQEAHLRFDALRELVNQQGATQFGKLVD